MMKRILFVLLCALWTAEATAQIGATLRGRLLDEGQPMEYVYIILSSTSPSNISSPSGSTSPSNVSSPSSSDPSSTSSSQSPPDSKVVAARAFTNGDFEFTGLKNGDYLLSFTCLGYVEKAITVKINGANLDLGDIAMQMDVKEIGTVTVTAKRPLFKQEQGKLIVNVDRTILSSAGTLNDLLKRSPGLVVDDRGISVFGKGTPIIYIDNKQVVSSAELQSLQSTDIDRIEIDRNPSARYSAAGHAVVKIITKRAKMDKLSLILFDNIAFSRKVSNTAGVQLDHKSGKWANLLSYSFSNSNQLYYSKSYEVNTLPAYTIWNDEDMVFKQSYNGHNVFSGNEYSINNRHRLGFQFSGVWNNGRMKGLDNQTIRKTGNPDVFRKIERDETTASSLYNTNVSYQLNPDSVNNLSLVLSYANMDNGAEYRIVETELADNSVTNSHIKSSSVYSVYAAQADWRFDLLKFMKMSVGAKYSQVIDDGKSNHWDTDTGTFKYDQTSRINDKIAAGYFEFSKEIGKFSMRGGLRYEFTSSDTHAKAERVDTTYHGLFPSLSLDYSKEKWNVNLSYSRRIGRPSFNQINPNMVYFNALAYSIGNPFLRPVYSNNVALGVSLYDFTLTADYTHRKDYIVQTAINDRVNPNITCWTYFNIDNTHSFTLGLTYAKSWRFYSGSYEVYVQKPYVKVPYLGETITRQKPIWTVSVSNTFNVTKNLSLNCNFHYESKGEDGITRWESSFNVMAGALWKLFDNRLWLSLHANDIFRTQNSNSWEDRYGNIITGMKSNQDSRYVRFGIRWNFNSIRSGVRRNQSNAGELNRL